MQLNSIEEVIADERFLAWYFKTDFDLAQEWEMQLAVNPHYKLLSTESVFWLENHLIKEKEVPSQQVEAACQTLQQALQPEPAIRQIGKRKRWWLPAAAAVLLLIAGLVFVTNWPKKTTTLANTYGQIANYKLPDGSQVILNANSQLKMNEDWDKAETREVWLKGEAFFMVQKTARKSNFIVHADALDVIVTGTQFNVVNRDGETNVLLTEGSVIVRTEDGKQVHMKPGDFLRSANQSVTKKVVNQEKVLAWKQSKLVLDNTSMQELAQLIEQYYGVKVVFADAAAAQKHIGAAVMPNDNLDVLIQSLEATGEFSIKKNNKEIIISIP